MVIETESLFNTSKILLKVTGSNVVAVSNNSDLTLIPCRTRELNYKSSREMISANKSAQNIINRNKGKPATLAPGKPLHTLQLKVQHFVLYQLLSDLIQQAVVDTFELAS